MIPQWIDLTALQNPKNKFKTLLPLIILAVLLILIPLGIYLVKQPQIFKPKAQELGSSLYLKPQSKDLYKPVFIHEEFQVNAIADSQGQTVNNIDAKFNFDKNLLQVVSVNTTNLKPPYFDPILPEGERCNETAECKIGLECRPICEPNPGVFNCDAVGSICKQPKKSSSIAIDAKFDNSQGVVTLKGDSASGATLDNSILATITFRALKPGNTTINTDPASVFLQAGSNILSKRSDLDVKIEQLQACNSDKECQEGYYCNRENMPKYCALGDCPDSAGFCKPKPALEKGDGNNDGVIDWADLSVLYSNFFKNKPELDFNNDGTVNSIDYSLLIQIFKEKGVIQGGR